MNFSEIKILFLIGIRQNQNLVGNYRLYKIIEIYFLHQIPLRTVYTHLNMILSLQMFVRLFVDENLDRHVPISKQPKEKIQAIIDSCTRQFPEYSERARKRIRTYLKSCRRTKRSREQAGLDINNVRLLKL